MIVATTEIAVMTGIAATIVAEMSVAVGKAAAEIAAMTGVTGKPSLDCRNSPFFCVLAHLSKAIGPAIRMIVPWQRQVG